MQTAIKRPLSAQKRLGLRIKVARVSYGITQKELAKRVCTIQGTISHFEQGIRIPDALMLMAIARVLEQDLEYFKV